MSPLILGGHSFIAQLGNEPKPSDSEIDAIVATCLDAGIVRFDTTYRPERIALGASLARLGRRREARVIVWNFFENFGDGAPVGGASAYRPEHLEEILDDLQTDTVDELVVHRIGDDRADAVQEELALSWKEAGVVGRLGIWAPGLESANWPHRAIYDFAVEPHNLFTQSATEKIACYARNGWEVYACSPYVRGWQMDKLISVARQEHGMPESTARPQIADLLLRYALFAPEIDALIVAMRRPDWVHQNMASVTRGPLTEAERLWLETLKTHLE